MRRSQPARRLGAGIGLALAACLVGPGTGLGLATFGDTAQTLSTLSTAACFPADTTPPTVDATVISKAVQYLPGYIRQGGTYQVYAMVSDGGCGVVASVRANVSVLSASQSNLNLNAGTFAVGGVSYGRRSGSVTVRNPLAEGTYAYSITATDAAGNSQLSGGHTVIVDNTRPTGAAVQTANGGATPGRPEAGDSVTFTWSEIVDPQGILAGWTGTPTSVVARIANNASNDRLTVRNAANTAALPFGTTSLAGNYVSATRNFGATGTASTMTWGGDSITITLGTPSGATLTGAAGAMSWPPSGTATDRAGNACLTTAATEPGPADAEF
jgi:hypothetical protein